MNPTPSILSVQSAPSSVYEPLWTTFTSADPESVTTGAVVSIINVARVSILLGPPPSSTVIVQVLYVPSQRVLKVITLLPVLASIVSDVQGQP